MPNTASAKKSLRKNEARRLRNRSQRTALRNVIKRFRTAAIAGTDAEATETAFRTVVKKLDQAAAGNLIHKNKAARLKSRLSHFKKRQQTQGAASTQGAGAEQAQA